MSHGLQDLSRLPFATEIGSRALQNFSVYIVSASGVLGRFQTPGVKLMTGNIYRTVSTQNKGKRIAYAYEDDPTYIAFRAAVWNVCDRNGQPRLNNSKLYALWYCSKTFHCYWKGRPSKNAANNMVYILGHNFLTDSQSQLVIMAWLKQHLPNLSQSAYEKYEDDLFWPTWERIQPSVQKARDRKNARRREKRREKNMKTQQAKQRASLKSQVLHILKQHPMTTAVLAAKLSAHPKAVDGHLYRMTKTGEVVKVGRGLYALPGTVEAVPAEIPSDSRPSQSVNADPPRQPVEPANLKKVTTEEIAENSSTDETSAGSPLNGSHEKALNLDDIDEFDDDIYMPGLRTTFQPKTFPASMPHELPTATPQWDRR